MPIAPCAVSEPLITQQTASQYRKELATLRYRISKQPITDPVAIAERKRKLAAYDAANPRAISSKFRRLLAEGRETRAAVAADGAATRAAVATDGAETRAMLAPLLAISSGNVPARAPGESAEQRLQQLALAKTCVQMQMGTLKEEVKTEKAAAKAMAKTEKAAAKAMAKAEKAAAKAVGKAPKVKPLPRDQGTLPFAAGPR